MMDQKTTPAQRHAADPRVPDHEMRSPEQGPPPGPDPVEAEREIIATESVEGRPAHPEVGPRALMFLLAVAAFALLVTAVVLGMFISAFAAVAVGAFAVLLIIVNPVFWASLGRSKERKAAADRTQVAERVKA